MKDSTEQRSMIICKYKTSQRFCSQTRKILMNKTIFFFFFFNIPKEKIEIQVAFSEIYCLLYYIQH